MPDPPTRGPHDLSDCATVATPGDVTPERRRASRQFVKWGSYRIRGSAQCGAALFVLRSVFWIGLQLRSNECASTHAADPLCLGSTGNLAGAAGPPLSGNFAFTDWALQFKGVSFPGNDGKNCSTRLGGWAVSDGEPRFRLGWRAC